MEIYRLCYRQRSARLVDLKAVNDARITIKIISGTRTFAEQNALYRQGRDLPEKGHEWRARGPEQTITSVSLWDIGVFQNGQYQDGSPSYKTV